MHWEATQRMIADNGGLLSFRNEPLVFTKYVWTAIALSGTSEGFPAGPINDKSYRELSDLLLKRRSTMVKALPTSQDQHEKQKDTIRTKIFRNQTRLDTLLNSTSDANLSDASILSVRECCRMAIILFLACAMEEYGDFSRVTESYLSSVEEHLDQRIDDSALSSEHLLWFMIRLSFLHPVRTKCLECWVAVVRMMTAWKTLAIMERHTVQTSLWKSLDLAEITESTKVFSPINMTPISTPWQACGRTVPKDCHCELLWFTVPS